MEIGDNRMEIGDMARGMRVAIGIGLVFALSLVMRCRQKDMFQKIRDGDFSIVVQDTYRGHAIFLRDAGEFEDVVVELRTEIEENMDVLPVVTRKFFSVSQELHFKFKLIMFDKEKDYLILRYFARIGEHPLYAGYQIQFVVDRDARRIIKIYTAEVPLE
jgi:hypothetical protein